MKLLVENYDSVIDEIKPLLEEHWAEIAVNKDKVPLNPNYFMYKDIEDKGLLDIFTARDDGNLVGYCIVFTMPHIHYSSTIISNVDIFYLHPDYRGKMIGLKLLKFTEKKLKEKGVEVLVHHVKVQHDFSPMLERIGYNKDEYILSKYIGD